MTRFGLLAVLAVLAALASHAAATPAAAQTYHDSGGTVIPGAVPVAPGVGPLFTQTNPGIVSGVAIIQATNSTAVEVTSATTTEILPPSSNTAVTHYDFTSSGTGTIELEYGTKVTTACDTGATPLTGLYPVTATKGVDPGGSGLGPIVIVPAGKELCIVTTAAATAHGVVAWTRP